MPRLARRFSRLALGALLLACLHIGSAAADNPVPFIDADGQRGYQRYLDEGFHRVFAISEHGGYGAGWGNSTIEGATSTAMTNCGKRDPGGPCRIYAVDGYVVWGKDPDALPRYADAPKLGAFIPSDYTPVRGPQVAAGLVIWSHGYLPGVDSTTTQPQGYVARLLAQGWDIYRYNREYIAQMHKEIAEMIDSIEAARRAGYKKIVIAGQSHGAWISLEALARGAPLDGVISVSPAHHGSPPSSAARSDFRELLRQIRKRNDAHIPLVIALFQNDGYDPGGRFADIPDLLGDTAIPLYFIDRPADLSGHGAGNSAKFNERFGGCIVQFVTASPYAAGHCQ
jgi:dienelactone hydrolase